MHAAPPVSADRTELEELQNVPPPVPPAVVQRVRSLAERVMFEALERRRATRGRFELNGIIDALFGPREAEIDLIDRNLRIAVEIDGFHHFTDSDAYRRDRRKDVLLQNEGFLVIRILADDVLEAVEEAVDRVVAASALRRTRTGSP
jgi:very-short-patch-repair endonuclease